MKAGKSMKTSSVPMLILSILTCFAITYPSRSEQPKPPDPHHPFGPSGHWFSKGLGWELGNKAHYAVHLLFDPPLTYEGVEPIGLWIQNIRPSFGNDVDSPPKQPAPTHPYFEGLIWTLMDQFGYSARVVIGQDQSLIGFAFCVWNNSKNHPLTLMRRIGAPLFLINISIDGKDMPAQKRAFPEGNVKRDESKEWTLKPREKSEIFVPLRDLLPEGFDPKDGKKCTFNVHVNVVPKGTPVMFESPFPSPIFPFTILVTKIGLTMDPKAALKEAATNTPDLFKK